MGSPRTRYLGSAGPRKLHFPEAFERYVISERGFNSRSRLQRALNSGGDGNMADVLSVGVNLEAFSQAISAIQALRSSVSRVFDCLKDGMRNKETLEGREKAFIAHFQDNLHSVNRDLK